MNQQSNGHLHPFIKKRKSIVSFSPENLSSVQIELLFEAARWSASSYNRQPWRFIAVEKEDTENFSLFLNLLSEANRSWAMHAPLLVLSVAETFMEDRGKQNYYAFHDLGMATSNLMFQAVSMSLNVHIMGGYDMDKARELLGIPETFGMGAMMAIGYQGEIDHLPPDLKRRELAKRIRTGRHETVFRAAWGRPFFESSDL